MRDRRMGKREIEVGEEKKQAAEARWRREGSSGLETNNPLNG